MEMIILQLHIFAVSVTTVMTVMVHWVLNYLWTTQHHIHWQWKVSFVNREKNWQRTSLLMESFKVKVWPISNHLRMFFKYYYAISVVWISS